MKEPLPELPLFLRRQLLNGRFNFTDRAHGRKLADETSTRKRSTFAKVSLGKQEKRRLDDEMFILNPAVD